MNITVPGSPEPDTVGADQARASSIATCIPTRNRPPTSMRSCRSAGGSIAAVDRRPLARAVRRTRRTIRACRPVTGMRMDSLAEGRRRIPGSDLAMMQEQLLDLFDVSYGMMMPLVGRGGDERNVEFGAAHGDRGERMGGAGLVRPRAAAEGGDPDHHRVHRGRDRGDREARRRPPFRPGDDPAARAGAAGPPPLLADPGSLRRQRISRSRCISAAPAAIPRPAAAGRRSITRSIRPIRRRRRRWSPAW